MSYGAGNAKHNQWLGRWFFIVILLIKEKGKWRVRQWNCNPMTSCMCTNPIYIYIYIYMYVGCRHQMSINVDASICSSDEWEDKGSLLSFTHLQLYRIL